MVRWISEYIELNQEGWQRGERERERGRKMETARRLGEDEEI